MVRRGETQIDPDDRDERLGEAIEAYLEQAESGSPPDPESFAAAYPELGDDLVAALEGLALVQGLVGDSGGSGPGHRLEAGRRVAGYRIVRELGRGGMGIVYEAVHVGLDRPVALKVLGSSAAPDSTARRRFLNEAKTAAGLHHTHIVPVFDVGQVGGLCYYAMQKIGGAGLDRVLRLLRRDRTVAAGSTYVPGPARPGSGGKPRPGADATADPAPSLLGPAPSAASLGDETRSWASDARPSARVRGGSPAAIDDDAPPYVPPRGGAYYRWVAEVGRQAAEALGHAHHQGVIHRDIKPSNLLIDDRGAIWVADFGLARRLADPSQTQVDSLLGTPRYMSPEQARTGAIDGRSDVYSLGATLYELVTLRPPFDGKSAAELVEQISGREPPRPRRFDPKVPLDLETILLKALAKRPDDRYASADDLADDLGRFLRLEPVRARRIGPIGRLWRFARRHPGGSLVTTAAVSIVLTVATVAYARVVNARNRAIAAGKLASAAQLETERVNRRLQEANAATRAAVRDRLASLAQAMLVTHAPNRRTEGLKLLGEAAGLGPDPGLQVQLRDQALGFLAIRDVRAQAAIPTPRTQHGLVFGPDGRRVAAVDDDGHLNVWDLDRRERVDASREPVAPRRSDGPGRGRAGGRLTAPGSLGQVAVIRPDGDGLRFFEASAPSVPAEVWAMPGHDLAAVLATPTGHRFVLVERGDTPQDDPRITLWSRDQPDAPRAILDLPAPPADATPPRRGLLLAIAPDGLAVAAARSGESRVVLWDGSGRPLPPIEVAAEPSAIALGPGGLMAIAEGGNVALWDLTPRRQLTALVPQQGFVNQLRFSPGDGGILAGAGWNGIELWDLATHATVATLPTRDPVDDLAFSPDGHVLAASHPASIAAGHPASITSWTLVEPAGQIALPNSPDSPTSLSFSPDGPLAIASRDTSNTREANFGLGPVRIWAGPGRAPADVETWPQLRASALAFDGDGNLITVNPRRLTWTELDDPLSTDEVDIPEPAPDGSRPGDGPGPGRERPTGPRGGGGTGRPPGPAPAGGSSLPPVYRANISTLARSDDGRTLAMARWGEVLIWRDDHPSLVARVDLPGWTRNAWLRFLALSRDGSRLAYSTPYGDRVQCVELRPDSSARVAWTVSCRDISGMAADAAGSVVAVSGRGGEVTLIDVATGLVRDRIPAPGGETKTTAEPLALSPDGRMLAIGGRDQIRLWSVAGTPAFLAHIPGPRGQVGRLAFDAPGQHLAASDENRSVRIWDLAALRRELGRLKLDWR